MITIESLMSIDKSNLTEAAKKLNQEDIPKLVEWLSLKEDATRYQAFLLLQNRSQFFGDVYPFWDIFHEKLKSSNSYQRSLGLMLLAENVKWDSANRMEAAIDDYLQILNDEKSVTVRQCIQALSKIVMHNPGLSKKIAGRLISIDLMSVKETMRKSILLDIVNILLIIRKELKSDSIETFIQSALASDILDKKSIKQIESHL
jgi:hypothetical protein